jgi:hypothetical protein
MYLGRKLTNGNEVNHEIMGGIHSEHASCYSVKKLSSHLHSKMLKIGVDKTIILLPIVLYECGMWSLSLVE